MMAEHRPILWSVAGLLLYLIASPKAAALPKFAQREKKPCAFCHVKPAGGGRRNAAGHWYETHCFSFRGYRPKQARSQTGPPGRALKKPLPKTKRKK